MHVFVLEDDPERIRQLCDWLKDTQWDCIQTCTREDEFRPPYDLILLDHDLGGRQLEPGMMIKLEAADARKVVGEVIIQDGYGSVEDNGLSLVKLIKDRINPEAEIIIHSFNPEGARNMQLALKPLHASRIPFGPSLRARIELLKKVH